MRQPRREYARRKAAIMREICANNFVYARICAIRDSVRAIPFADPTSQKMLYWLLYMMGLGIFSDDDDVCYEESEEEDVHHDSPPKNNEQAICTRA